MLLVPHYTHAVCALVLQKVLSDLVVGSAWQACLYCSKAPHVCAGGLNALDAAEHRIQSTLSGSAGRCTPCSTVWVLTFTMLQCRGWPLLLSPLNAG